VGEVVHFRPFVRRRRLLAALSLLALAAPTGAASAAVPTAERSALVSFYNATGGPRWTDRSGWLGAAGTECSWKGVQCSATGTTVTGLALSENGLAGKMPTLAGLPNLASLDLGLNQLSGGLPKELGNLRKLQALVLPFNQLTGSLPAELGGLTALKVLDLSGNKLSGSLPPEIGTLSSLTYLDLSGNQITAPIPWALGQLRNLQTLYLDDNQISGSISPTLGSLGALEQMGLSGNQFSGTIPPELGKLSSLMFLNLSKNQLGGPVPPQLGDATSLIGVLLSSNQLAGTLPGSFLNAPNLETLWLDHNRFTGPVPFELGAIPTLDDHGGLDLRFNALATDTEPGLLADLNTKQVGGNWTGFQTAAAALDARYPLTGLADRRTGGWVVWTLQVAAGAPPLFVSAYGGTGNADLFVRFGAAPTATQFDASSTNSGNLEVAAIPSPKTGTYYIALRATSPYEGTTLQVGGSPGFCVPGDTNLCLSSSRFRVDMTWRTRDGRTGQGHAVSLTGDTGYFWFFDASNVEAVVKVLDACSINQKAWVYAGGLTDVQTELTVTDTRTGAIRTYRNPQGSPFQPVQDTAAFSACGGGGNFAGSEALDLGTIAETAGSCAPGSTSLCLSGGRFRVETTWKTPDGQTGAGQAVPLTADTGYFWFFGDSNVEMVIKVLNACGLNGKFWVYAGGLTNVQVEVTVTDTQTGVAKTYHNPQGTAFRPVQDTSAFSTCP